MLIQALVQEQSETEREKAVRIQSKQHVLQPSLPTTIHHGPAPYPQPHIHPT